MRPIVPWATVAALIIGGFCLCTLGNAQDPSVSIQGHLDAHGKVVYVTYLAGQLLVSRDITGASNAAFSWASIRPLKKGDVLSAQVSEDQSWSVETAQLSDAPFDGKDNFPFPVMAQLEHQSVFPAVLKMKVAIKPGAVIHAGGYEILASRAVSPGDTIPIRCVGNDSLLAVWADPDVKPWLTVFKDGAKPTERALDVEAWLVFKNHVDGTIKQ